MFVNDIEVTKTYRDADHAAARGDEVVEIKREEGTYRLSLTDKQTGVSVPVAGVSPPFCVLLDAYCTLAG